MVPPVPLPPRAMEGAHVFLPVISSLCPCGHAYDSHSPTITLSSSLKYFRKQAWVGGGCRLVIVNLITVYHVHHFVVILQNFCRQCYPMLKVLYYNLHAVDIKIQRTVLSKASILFLKNSYISLVAKSDIIPGGSSSTSIRVYQ